MWRQHDRTSHDKSYRSLPQMVASCADGHLLKLFVKPSKPFHLTNAVFYCLLCKSAGSPNFYSQYVTFAGCTIVDGDGVQLDPEGCCREFLKTFKCADGYSTRINNLTACQPDGKINVDLKTICVPGLFPSVSRHTMSFFISHLVCIRSSVQMHLYQGSPKYVPRAKSGPRSHFFRPSKTFCQ